MKKSTLILTGLFVAIILLIGGSINNGVGSTASFCGKIVTDGYVCNQGDELTCSNGSKVFNSRFIPENKNIYYALITLRCPEFGGFTEDSNAGDRDSCGLYQQRVSEYMNPDPNSQTSKSSIARAYLGLEYNSIFNVETISFINEQNSKANGYSGAVDYGQKMRDICSRIIKAGGSEFFDMLQVARFKERNLTQNRQGNFYKLLSDFELTPKTADRFAFELAESHQPSSQFRTDWEARAKASLKNFLENQEYQKVKAKCSGNIAKRCNQKYILPVKKALFYCNFGKNAICKTDLTTQFNYSDSNGKIILHDGLDFSTEAGTPVYAIADGEIKINKCPDQNVTKTCNGGFGNFITIKHDKTLGVDFKSSYGHLSKTENISDGTIVKKGDKIGEVGTTGNSTGNHLHLQIKRISNSNLVDPCSGEFGLPCPELGTYIKEN